MSRCALFPRLRTESSLKFCLDEYCHGEFARCSRFQYAKANGAPPDEDLLPNGKRLKLL